MSTAILARTERKRLVASLLRLRATVFLAAGVPLLLSPDAAVSGKMFGLAAIGTAVAAPIAARRFDHGSGVWVAAATDLVVAFGLWLFVPHAAGIALMLSMWAVAYVVFLGTPAEARSIAVSATVLELSKLLIVSLAPDAWQALPGVAAGDHDAILIVGGAVAITGAYFAFRLIDRHFAALNEAAESGEDRYRKLIDSAPLAFLVVVNESITYINDAGERLLDPNGDTVIGHIISEHVAEESWTVVADALEHVVQTFESVELEDVGLRATDGSNVRVDVSASAVDFGNEIGVQVALYDRTAQLVAEDRLRRREMDYQTFFERIPVALYRSRPDGYIENANDALVELLGVRDKTEVIGRDAASFYADQGERDHLSERLGEEGTVVGYEWRLRRADGSLRWVRDTSRLIATSNGLIYEGSMVDITARRNVEGEVWSHAVQQEAAASIGQLALETDDVESMSGSVSSIVADVLDVESVAVLGRDDDGRFVTFGQSQEFGADPSDVAKAADLSHMSAEPVVATSMAEMKIMAPELVESGFLSCAVLTVPSKEISFGTLAVLSTSERTFSADDLNFLHSVSNVLAAAVDRASAYHKLESLVRSKDAFVASVSHELRTPLTVVTGLAHELNQRWMSLSDDEMVEFTSMLVSQSRDMGDLIEDLLVAARSNIGNVAVRTVPVSLAAEVDGVLAGFGSPGGKVLSSDVTDVVAEADPIRVRQILRNLVSNAIRYGGDQIEVVGYNDAGVSVIEVCDSGPEIGKADRERIFEPYERAHVTEGTTGSVGLGLSVSRTLAELMHGSLTYRYDGRSVFRLELLASAGSPADVRPHSGMGHDETLSAFGTIGSSRIGVDVGVIQ
jgi:PAS domain S-box-containing protein